MRANMICPGTGDVFSFQVETNTESVTRDWKKSIQVACPHCGDGHAVPYKEIYIDGVLSGFREDFDRMLAVS